jgi:hypothetical protein
VKNREFVRAPIGDKLHYLFAGIGRCAECDGPMKLTNLVLNEDGTLRNARLKCRTNYDTDSTVECDAKTSPYGQAEKPILEAISKALAYRMTKPMEARRDETQERLIGDRDRAATQFKTALDYALMSPASKAVAERLQQLEAEVQKLDAKIRLAAPPSSWMTA